MSAGSDIIVRHPEILGGIPVFRGTRVPFKNLLDYVEGGHTLDQFLEDFPSVTREAAIAALGARQREMILRSEESGIARDELRVVIGLTVRVRQKRVVPSELGSNGLLSWRSRSTRG